jgi:hypothetical protein
VVHVVLELQPNGLVKATIASGTEEPPPNFNQEWWETYLDFAVAWLAKMGGGQMLVPMYGDDFYSAN